MLPDKFFRWPYGLSLEPALADLAKTFAKFRWPFILNDPARGSLLEHVAFMCRQHDISPQWLMVSAQREQSGFRGPDNINSAAGVDLKAICAWLGVVGQDVGRVAAPGYYGAFQQVDRFTEQCAWLLGALPADHWTPLIRSGKASQRYRPGSALSIKSLDEFNVEYYTPLSAGEYLMLAFTPHKKALETNEAIAQHLGFI